MHNGVFDTLDEVMNFYNRPDVDAVVPEVASNVDNRGNPGELNLTPAEIQHVIALLRNLANTWPDIQDRCLPKNESVRFQASSAASSLYRPVESL